MTWHLNCTGCSEKVDAVVLITGDGDFVPLVEFLKRAGGMRVSRKNPDGPREHRIPVPAFPHLVHLLYVRKRHVGQSVG